MKVQFAIPATLLLGTSTTMTGCADPIVGTWIGESFSSEGETVEIPYSYNGVEVISSMDMTFDADLTGKFEQIGYGGEYSMDLEAVNNGSGSYSIKATNEDDTDTLDCTLSSSTLECSIDDVVITMSAGTKD